MAICKLLKLIFSEKWIQLCCCQALFRNFFSQKSTLFRFYSLLKTQYINFTFKRLIFLFFRCYDLLIRSHPEKLVSGLLLRLNSVDENIRVSSLIVFRHLMNSSLDVLQTRMTDIFNALHAKLNETSNRVRKMLAQLTALLGSLGFLEGSKGHDFLEFIIRLCALPSCDQRGLTSNDLLTYLTSGMLLRWNNLKPFKKHESFSYCKIA